jgi:hypothetical protein
VASWEHREAPVVQTLKPLFHTSKKMNILLLLSVLAPSAFCTTATITGDGSDQALELMKQIGISYEGSENFNIDNSTVSFKGSTSSNGIVR